MGEARAITRGTARMRELDSDGLTRRFLIVIPRADILALRDRRLAELRLDPGDPPDPHRARLQQRLAAAVLTEAEERAGRDALSALLRRLGLQPAGQPRVTRIPGDPDGDLSLRAEMQVLPEPEAPDIANLRIALAALPSDPRAEDRELAAIAEAHASWQDLPPGTQAEPGDVVVCDVDARLEPAASLLPNAAMEDGAPRALPRGWFFGNNRSGLTCEVLAAERDASPAHIRLRVHGAAAASGQCYVMFHPEKGIAVPPGATWVGSASLRLTGQPSGLRGGKLRIYSKPAMGGATLRRKDCALPPDSAQGFARIYVSDTFAEPDTAFLRMAMLFDHAAGAVDFTFDLAAPRLVEGLDFGSEDAEPLPAFSGTALRIAVGESRDAAGLGPRLVGIAAGDARDLAVRLPSNLPDRALAGRPARFAIAAHSVLRRRVPPLDDAFAARLGFGSLSALRAEAAKRVSQRRKQEEDRLLGRAALDALLAAGGGFPVPEAAVRAELAAIWPHLSAEAASRGDVPRADEAMAKAARNVRLRLLLCAVARRHGIAASADASIEDRVLAFLLTHARMENAGSPAAPGRVDAPCPAA